MADGAKVDKKSITNQLFKYRLAIAQQSVTTTPLSFMKAVRKLIIMSKTKNMSTIVSITNAALPAGVEMPKPIRKGTIRTLYTMQTPRPISQWDRKAELGLSINFGSVASILTDEWRRSAPVAVPFGSGCGTFGACCSIKMLKRMVNHSKSVVRLG